MATRVHDGQRQRAGATVAFENELVRVDRVTLAPGQSTSAHTHPRSHLFVAVHAGSVKMEAQGYPAATRAMKPGDFDWHTGAYTHNVTNVGHDAVRGDRGGVEIDEDPDAADGHRDP